MSDDKIQKGESANEFANQASGRQSNLVVEILSFLRHTGKWWLAPAFVLLLIVGLLVVFGGTTVAPFIYTLF